MYLSRDTIDVLLLLLLSSLKLSFHSQADTEIFLHLRYKVDLQWQLLLSTADILNMIHEKL